MNQNASRILIGIIISIGVWSIYTLTKETIVMLDPLKYSSLPDADIRMYRYLHALQELSGVQGPHPSLNVEEIQEYIATHRAVQCVKQGCDRWYINEITTCPVDKHPTRTLDPEEFIKLVYSWELFRHRYAETSRIRGLTRVWAIKLAYLMAHPLES